MRQILFALLCGAASLAAQDFQGTWEARVGDTVVCTFRFHGAPIEGTDLGCYIAVNGQGEWLVPTNRDPYPPKRLANLQVNGSTLSFEIPPAEGDDDPLTLQMELKQTSDGKAELRFLNFPVPVKAMTFQRRR